MRKGNPTPKVENLILKPRIDENEPCAPKPVQVKVPMSKYEQWMQLPAEIRTKVLRDAIDKAVENKELLLANSA